MGRSKGFNQFQSVKKRSLDALPKVPMDITIDGMTHDGRGVGRCDNKVVFVAGAIPGERVRARILARKKQYDEAVAESWLVKSDQRREAFCPVYEQCGGCQLQHMVYDAQLAFKQERLDQVIRSIDAGMVSSPDAILSASEQHYRHRARLTYRAGHLGFMAKSSHQIVDIHGCPVLMTSLNNAFIASRDALLH